MTGRAGAAGRTDGFVLVEVLVTLVLVAFIAGLGATMLGFGQRVAARALARDTPAHLATGSQALAGWLASASPWRPVHNAVPGPVLFEGRPDRLGFISIDAGDARPPGLMAVTVGFAAGASGRPGRLVFDTISFLPSETRQPDRTANDLLVADVLSARFSYFGAATSSAVPGWRDEWSAAAVLPRLVALDARLGNGTRTEDVRLVFRVRPE